MKVKKNDSRRYARRTKTLDDDELKCIIEYCQGILHCRNIEDEKDKE